MSKYIMHDRSCNFIINLIKIILTLTHTHFTLMSTPIILPIIKKEPATFFTSCSFLGLDLTWVCVCVKMCAQLFKKKCFSQNSGSGYVLPYICNVSPLMAFSLSPFLHPSLLLVFLFFLFVSPTLLQVIKALPVHPLGGRVLTMVTEH